MAQNIITITGNLTADPELRFTKTGKEVASITIASTESKYDRATGTYENGETLFLNGTAWGKLAQNIATSLHKGIAVVATGELKQRNYTANDGTNRSVFELSVKNIGVDLNNYTVTATKASKKASDGIYASESSVNVTIDNTSIDNAPAPQSSPDVLPWDEAPITADVTDSNDLPF